MRDEQHQFLQYFQFAHFQQIIITYLLDWEVCHYIELNLTINDNPCLIWYGGEALFFFLQLATR